MSTQAIPHIVRGAMQAIVIVAVHTPLTQRSPVAQSPSTMHPLVTTATQRPAVHDWELMHRCEQAPQWFRSVIRLTQPALGHAVWPIVHDVATHAPATHASPIAQHAPPHAVWPVMHIGARVQVARSGVELCAGKYPVAARGAFPSWPPRLLPQQRTSPLWRRAQV